MSKAFDVAVVGMGIVGLAHAYAAARAGKTVIVFDRTARAIGASIRNFGFITVTGQERSEMWPLAMRTRNLWDRIAPEAGIGIDQRGLSVVARRTEAVPVLEAFAETEMGEGCTLVSADAYRARYQSAGLGACRAVLVSPHELRVEPSAALPKLAAWLAERWHVVFRPSTAVLACETGRVVTPGGTIDADQIFVCPGDDLSGLFPDVMAAHGVTRCKLQMMRLAPMVKPLPMPVMSDLSLVRYQGYADLPEAAGLRSVIETEQKAHLEAGVHLIVVQASDGSLIVGDSHVYEDAPDPFHRRHINELILSELETVLPGRIGAMGETWVGTYAWSPNGNWFSEDVAPGVLLTVVTCGAGMSTAFAIAEDVVGSYLNSALADAV